MKEWKRKRTWKLPFRVIGKGGDMWGGVHKET